VLFAACSTGQIDLSVDVRTDYVAGRDFVMVVTELGTPSFASGAEVRAASMPADGAEDFLRGERVAELAGVRSGPVSVRVRLVDAAGAIVAERILDLVLERSYAATVLITSNCAGISCPAPSGAPELAACLDGACVDPRCSPATRELCPPPCESDEACGDRVGCTATTCIEGTCFCAGPLRDAGPPPDADLDAGPPCECEPGEMETEMRACGSCDSGTQARARACEPTCTFGPWEDWGTCMGATGCMPGATRACPNGDSCGHQVCDATCEWGGCELLPGADCFRIGPGQTLEGTNYRCCGSLMWQYCLAGCVWSSACNACAPANCPDC
jgi:hypothetical protein